MNEKLLIYEFDCLCSLLSTDKKILKKVFSNIVIPRLAYYEYKNRMDKSIQQTIKSLMRSKFIILEDFDINTPEYNFYKTLIKGIKCKCRGKCESAAITIAKHNNLTILSNNYDENYKSEYNLNYLSMKDFISDAYNNNRIDINEAEIFWSKIVYKSHDNISISFAQFIDNSET